jgi:hypothetical protein
VSLRRFPEQRLEPWTTVDTAAVTMAINVVAMQRGMLPGGVETYGMHTIPSALGDGDENARSMAPPRP